MELILLTKVHLVDFKQIAIFIKNNTNFSVAIIAYFTVRLTPLIWVNRMERKNRKRIVDLEVIALSKKGNGLAWLEQDDGVSTQVEIPFTAPGDTVRAQLLGRQSGVYIARLLELLVSSPHRIASTCVHFGTCGGCRFQHISYENQLQHKELLIRQCFARLLTPDVNFRPIFASGQPWRYRNKMDYTFSEDLAGNKFLGLIQEGSKGIVLNLSECYLSNSWFIDAVNCVKEWWDKSEIKAYHHINNTGILRNLTLREGQSSGDRMVVLTIAGNLDFSFPKSQFETLVSELRSVLEQPNFPGRLSIFLRIQQVETGITTSTYEMLLHGAQYLREVLNIQLNLDEPPTSLTFEIGPSTFFQPNPKQTEQFYSLALRMAEIPRDAIVYDLYCGIGTIGLCVSKFVKQVIGFELSPESAISARNNAIRNNRQNVTFFSGAVRHMLQQIQLLKLPSPTVVIINPPRTGIDVEAMQHLLTLNPPKILYISCNPVTQAANIADLMLHGYRITTIQPVDQFPQTSHVENIVVLVKDKS